MEAALNILHYCLYKGHYKLHLLTNKINPFNIIHKLPFQKRRYEELGINIDKEINKAFGNKRYGLSVVVAGGALFGLLFLLLMGLSHLSVKLIDSNLILTLPYFVGFAFGSFIVCYIWVFRGDKYLKYFREFDKWSVSEKRRYKYFSMLFVVLVFILLISSFML